MRKRKRILATLLAIILIVTGAMNHANVLAVEVSESNESSESNVSSITKLDGTKKLDELRKQIDQLSNSQKDINLGYSAEDEVEIIVELKEDSLLDTYVSKLQVNKSQVYKQFDEYAKSSTGKALNNKLIKGQDLVLNKINNLDNQTYQSNISKIYNYTSVLNGFAIKATYGLLESIRNLEKHLHRGMWK